MIDAFFDLADAIITVRSLIRQAWATYRWDGRPARRPKSLTYPRELLSVSPSDAGPDPGAAARLPDRVGFR